MRLLAVFAMALLAGACAETGTRDGAQPDAPGKTAPAWIADPLPRGPGPSASFCEELPEIGVSALRADLVFVAEVAEAIVEARLPRIELPPGSAFDRSGVEEEDAKPVPVYSALLKVREVLSGAPPAGELRVLLLTERRNANEILRNMLEVKAGDLVLFILRANPPDAERWAKAPKRAPEEVRALIRRLGSEEFAEREKAMEALADLGPAALPFLEEAKETDPEVAWRAARLVQQVHAAFRPDTHRGFTKVASLEDGPVAEARKALRDGAALRERIERVEGAAPLAGEDFRALVAAAVNYQMEPLMEKAERALVMRLRRDPAALEAVVPLARDLLAAKCSPEIKALVRVLGAAGAPAADRFLPMLEAHFKASPLHSCAEDLLPALLALDREKGRELLAWILETEDPWWCALDYVAKNLEPLLAGATPALRLRLAHGAAHCLANKVNYTTPPESWAALFRGLDAPESVGRLIDGLAEMKELRDSGRKRQYWEEWMPRQLTTLHANVLALLTGQAFGDDAARWRAWWAENQAGFRFAK